MADITVDPAQVDPAKTAVIERGILAAQTTLGQLLYKLADETWQLADADVLASAQSRGMLVAGAAPEATVYPAGAVVDILVFGRTKWGSGMTVPARVYVSTTAGAGDQTAPAAAGDYPFSVGWAWAADELFFNPQHTIPTVNP